MSTQLSAQADPPCHIARLRAALGTLVGIEAYARDTRCLLPALVAAYAAIERVSRTMHPTRAGSDLAGLRMLGAGERLAVDPWTWECLQDCQQLYALSGGAFDPCLPQAPGRLEDLALLEGYRVRVGAAVQLDLGGIAKGVAIDRAMDALRAEGCESGLVNAGGDLRVFGPRDFSLLCRPGAGSQLGLSLRDAALAVSHSCPTDAPAEHRGYYDRRANPQQAQGSVAVVAPRAALADGLTKWLLLEQGARVNEALRRVGARVL